jgi:hypothetical protein
MWKCADCFPEAPIKFATRKMASVGAQGRIPQIFGLCCFLDTNIRLSQPKIPFESEEPVSVPLISRMCDELKRLLYETHTGPIASLSNASQEITGQHNNRPDAESLLSGLYGRRIPATIARDS